MLISAKELDQLSTKIVEDLTRDYGGLDKWTNTAKQFMRNTVIQSILQYQEDRRDEDFANDPPLSPIPK